MEISSKPWLGALALLALALISQGCTSYSGRLIGSKPAPLPLPEGIDVAFNHRESSHYRSPVHGDTRNGDNLEALLLNAIEAAQT